VLFQPVERPYSITEAIVADIKEALRRRQLLPGDRLPSEQEMAQAFGVGRTTIREAIRTLSALGIVEVKRGEGTFIATSPSSSLEPWVFALLLERGSSLDLLELRTMYEHSYTLLAAEKASPEDFLRIEKELLRLKDVVRQGELDREVLLECDLGFHLAILQATNNPFIIRIGRMILELFSVYIEKGVTSNPQRTIENHARILEAMKSQNREQIFEAVQITMDVWQKHLESL
jgi:GntR family transcriptional repressor for pyruvate dehydrogenase complex